MGHTLKGFHSALCVTALFAIVAPAAQAAELDEKFAFDIPSQSLESALLTLSKQAQFQLIVSDALPTHLTQRISGRMPIKRALEMLIKDTKLGYKVVGERTLALLPENVQSTSMREEVSDAEQGGLDSSGTENKKWTQLLMAQTDGAAPTTNELVSPASNEEFGRLEEIVVTAQKRDESLGDVPISIAVLRGDDLESPNTSSVADALKAVPGVALNQDGQSGGAAITIRGVSAGGPLFFGGPTVGFYLDSVPFGMFRAGFSPDANPYDLERVEVLRGPQGTLYGASALNGVVRVLTANPNLDAIEFKARASTSTTEGGDESYRGDAALNLPLVEGKFGIRLVAGIEDRGGWIDTPNLNARNVNDGEIQNYRIKVRARPIDELTIDLSAWSSREDYDGNGFSDLAGNNLTPFEQPVSVHYDIYGLNVGYDFKNAALTSSTSYMEFNNYSVVDGSFIPIFFGVPCDRSAVPTDPTCFSIATSNNASVFSQELTLHSNLDGPWKWTLGGIYRDAKEPFAQGFNSPAPPPTSEGISKSFAFFGELTRAFGQLELTGGLRYFKDKVEVSGFVPTASHVEGTFDAVSPRVVLSWKPNDDAMFYTSYSEGFRSGNPQSVDRELAGFPALEPDTLKNYEVGGRGTLFGNRLRYDVAVFYIDWQDIQQSLTVRSPTTGIPGGFLVNAGSASGPGFDFGIATTPANGLTLSANVGWNELTFDTPVVQAAAAIEDDQVLADKGDRIVSSPEWTVAASAEYVFALGGGYEGSLSTSANYTSAKIDRTVFGGQVLSASSDRTIEGTASFALETPGRVKATFFVDNITNEDGATSRSSFSTLPVIVTGGDIVVRPRPRTFGVQIDYRFGK